MRHVHTRIFHLLRISELDFTARSKRPASLLIYGLNKPFFLEDLVEKIAFSKPRYVAFVDHNIDNILTSLYTTDWSKIKKTLSNNRIASNFFLGDTPEEALQAFSNWVTNFSLYDAFNFQYYVDPIFNEEAKLSIPILQNPSIYQRAVTRGFIEDNLNIVINSISAYQESSHSKNITFLSFKRQPLTSTRTPAVLAASGPSLSSSLSFIKHNPQYPIFCAGSSVTSLLQAGIKPHYCVLVERNESVYYKHLSYSQYHSQLKNITLFAATSVDSRIFRFYRDVYLYTRESNPLSINTLPDNLLSHTHPTSVNAALSLMLNLCISDILLAGVDFSFSIREQTRDKYAHGKGSYRASYAVCDFANRTVFSESSLLRSYESALATLVDHPDVTLYNKSRPLSLPQLSGPEVFLSLQATPICLSNQSDPPHETPLSLPILISKLEEFKYFLEHSRSWMEDSWESGKCCPFTSFHNYLFSISQHRLSLSIVDPTIFELVLCYSRAYSMLSESFTEQSSNHESCSLFFLFLDDVAYMISLVVSILSDYDRK